ncbi:MAG: hypothetical protein HQM16_09510 [Deltaproteobacteria bacterium]|nr:hypothetical protein [Deltaproteobacteria bacterium]
MSKSVACTVDNTAQATNILKQLQTAGFQNKNISVLFPEREDTKQFVQEKHTKAPEGAAAGASTGGVIGGIVGWLVGIGSLAIPGIGPFIAAGPIMAALSGAAIGGAVGGMTGALVGLGIPEYEAKIYEKKIKEGQILISVHTEDFEVERRQSAQIIFKDAKATNISQLKAA